jgi:hypothetical protein
MKVYLLQYLYDNSAYVTQNVCLTKEIAEKKIIKYNKKGWKPNFRIEEEKVIEK